MRLQMVWHSKLEAAPEGLDHMTRELKQHGIHTVGCCGDLGRGLDLLNHTVVHFGAIVASRGLGARRRISRMDGLPERRCRIILIDHHVILRKVR